MRRITVHQHNKRILIVVASILAVIGVLGIGLFALLSYKSQETSSKDKAPTAKQAQPTDTSHRVQISAMGDMIAHDTITSNAKTTDGYDYTKYFQKIRPLYSASDVVFCNQESLSSGESFGISGYPAFNAPVKYAADLQTAGCNVINLANNHMGDKGEAAVSATVAEWEKLKPLAAAGANRTANEQQAVRYFEKNGIKFAFLAFMDFSNNKAISAEAVNNYHDTALLEKLTREARANADVVLVSMHWGTEDESAVNDDQRAQVARLAEYGADIVIGTGPHVLQAYEQVARPDGGTMAVWYSIGNMLSSQLKLEELTGGVAQMSVRKDGSKLIVEKPVFHPTFMSYEWTASEQTAGATDARKNPMIYPLEHAGDALKNMRMNATPESIRQQVQQTLGDSVLVK